MELEKENQGEKYKARGKNKQLKLFFNVPTSILPIGYVQFWHFGSYKENTYSSILTEPQDSMGRVKDTKLSW